MSNELEPVVSGTKGLPVATGVEKTLPQPVSATGTQPAVETAGGRAAREEAIREINKALEAASTSFRFAHDDDTNKIVVSVMDENTGKLIRQIPSPEQLAIAARLRIMAGLFFNQQV